MAGEARLIIVGVLERETTRVTFELMKDIFIALGYRTIYGTNENFICLLVKDNSYFLLMDLGPGKVSSITNLEIKYNIIIHTFLEPEDYNNKELKCILRESEYLLINSDEKEWPLLIEGIDKPIVLTYGFNNKATVNLSSYNINEALEANVCLQRKVCAINGKLIEPFELAIKMKGKNKPDIYSVIAGISCALVMGTDISSLKTFPSFK